KDGNDVRARHHDSSRRRHQRGLDRGSPLQERRVEADGARRSAGEGQGCGAQGGGSLSRSCPSRGGKRHASPRLAPRASYVVSGFFSILTPCPPRRLTSPFWSTSTTPCSTTAR